MKKFTLLFSIALLVFISIHRVSFAQVQRLVLVEEFTQASCPPCGSQNPAFNDLLNSNTDEVRSLKYQVNWPGFDPMNLHNPGQVTDRVNYYGVNGVPWGFTDGVSISNDCGAYLGAPACLSQSEIDNAYAITSPFTMALSHVLSVDDDSIIVTLTITAENMVTGDFKARIAVVEKEINFSTPPGSNGEKVFENVMKRMLPTSTGTSLPDTMDIGYTNTITVAWKLANIYDLNQLAVVAFIQNDIDKKIYQSAYSEPVLIENMATGSFSIDDPITCSGSVSPQVTIKNIGSSTITTATVSYYFGSNPPSTYDWSGSLAPGAGSGIIQLPSTEIPVGTYTIKGSVSNINGTPFSGQAALISNITFPNAIGFGASVASPITQSFNLIAFPPAGWGLSNGNASTSWVRSGSVGAYNVSPYGSGKYAFSSVIAGDVDELYVQNFDFSDVNQLTAFMEFDYAKAKKSGHNDELNVLASTDCGANWTSLFDQTDNTGLSTTTNGSSNWSPASSQWKSIEIDMTQFIGQSNVYVKFKTVSGYGNSLFLDNVNIHYGNPVGIADPVNSSVLLYPNPANESAVIHIGTIVSNETKLEIVNVLGQVIYSIPAKSNVDLNVNTSTFETGMYIYRLNDNGKILAQDKFNVSH